MYDNYGNGSAGLVIIREMRHDTPNEMYFFLSGLFLIRSSVYISMHGGTSSASCVGETINVFARNLNLTFDLGHCCKK